MSTEAYAIKSEIDLLTDRRRQLAESRDELFKFMNSKDFLSEKERFEELLAEFEENVVSSEVLGTPPSPVIEEQPATHTQQQQAETQQGERMTGLLVRALLVAVAIIAAGILEVRSQLVVPVPQATNGTITTVPTVIQTGYVPPGTLQWVAIGTILVISMPWIIDAARRLIETRGEKVERLSVEWISKNLNYVREKHLDACLMIKDLRMQESTPSDIMETDEVLYNRAKYLQVTLSTEFQKIIGEIYLAADRAIWIRKGILINAIVQSRMAVGRMR